MARGALLLMFLALNVRGAGPVVLSPQLITLPASASMPRFADVDGDGRPDLLVRRSDTQWNIFFSTTDGSWFAPQPAMTFDTPLQGFIEINDLNGDGLADIIWHNLDKNNLYIYRSPSSQAKGRKPDPVRPHSLREGVGRAVLCTPPRTPDVVSARRGLHALPSVTDPLP